MKSRKMNREERGQAHSGSSVLNNERGIVLVLVLILAAIALAFTAGLMMLVTAGTQTSGGLRRYETSLEAGRAGAEVVREMVDAQGIPDVGAFLTNFNIPALSVAGFDCLDEKLSNASHNPDGTVNWNGACDTSLNIDPALAASYDMTFDIGVNPSYTIYAKIVDTVDGNSGGNTNLQSNPGVVISHSGEITTQSLPFLYTIEILAEDTGNTAERSRLSILYQF